MYLDWDEKYSVGDDGIDQQHKELFKIINNLDDAIRNAQGKSAIHQILNEMNGYIAWHFNEEETYMKENDYPELNAHRVAHQTFVDETADAIKKLEFGFELGLALVTRKFLGEWIKKHVLVEDQKYKSYIQNKQQ